ncbi:MAG: SDR family NAD(P)-dependent oxidoreductase [Methylocella sp.]
MLWLRGSKGCPSYGRRGTAVKADIRDIAALRRIADQVEHEHGKIDIVVANAAIQGWKLLMEMDDMDWRDQIENNLNGAANTVRASGPKNGFAELWPFHPALVHAGQDGDKGRSQLLGVQVGHSRLDEVSGP